MRLLSKQPVGVEMSKKILTQDELKKQLHYCPETGVFTRLKTNTFNVKIGDLAGTLTKNGYISIKVNGTLFLAHRLAFLYMNGELPRNQVDHINHVKNNNEWDNLRDVTRSVNFQNQTKAHKNNATGYLGVFYDNGRFRAKIRLDGVSYHLGGYDTPEEAHKVYLKHKRLLHEGCTI